MSKHSAIPSGGSLLERAAEIYDFSSGLRMPAPLPPLELDQPVEEAEPAPPAPAAIMEAEEPRPAPRQAGRTPVFQPVEQARPHSGDVAMVNRDSLRRGGFILPDAAVTGLAEEFRLIKRQLLTAATGRTGIAEAKRRSVLVCSAQPDEGKTFCALNLALSLANERDLEVLLVDGDFPKPEMLKLLGIESGPGLVDVLSDPSLDAEDFVIRTDIGSLSVLPAGRAANNVPELLASERTEEVLASLIARNPRRIIIFDSPPALVASPASVLAAYAGQVLLVVRADKTTEADLRETVGLLSSCDNVSLILNGAGFAATGRRFGSYYGHEQ
jgi:exopolysaccharide/PEP-CTERM locus tyrosine autokinase